ncbi:MAG: hypothetical protein CMO80_17535 [Verrucomicrobiales bacterium]|nr:hypothetical protein [Verrucomicrobiales bacterium]
MLPGGITEFNHRLLVLPIARAKAERSQIRDEVRMRRTVVFCEGIELRLRMIVQPGNGYVTNLLRVRIPGVEEVLNESRLFVSRASKEIAGRTARLGEIDGISKSSSIPTYSLKTDSSGNSLRSSRLYYVELRPAESESAKEKAWYKKEATKWSPLRELIVGLAQ